MQTTHIGKQHFHEYKDSTLNSELIVIDRKFYVPVEELFQAFSTPEALKEWWWPKKLYSDHIDLDFRETGEYFINMKGFDHGGGGMTGQFLEIVINERIVMQDQFADARGKAITAKQAKMPGEWPEMCYITFDFFSEDKNTSSLKLSQQGVPNEAQKDCIKGWTSMFDKLEKFLKKDLVH
ncbi:MAG: SRPBCC domain-containing protein [Bacteriovorax sp.]|nr:SRPBCC domain-containing protein [Bacteriovorax sp.]